MEEVKKRATAEYFRTTVVGLVPVGFPFLLMLFNYVPENIYLLAWWFIFSQCLIIGVGFREFRAKKKKNETKKTHGLQRKYSERFVSLSPIAAMSIAIFSLWPLGYKTINAQLEGVLWHRDIYEHCNLLYQQYDWIFIVIAIIYATCIVMFGLMTTLVYDKHMRIK